MVVLADFFAMPNANIRSPRIAVAGVCALLLSGPGTPSGAGQETPPPATYEVVNVESGGSISGNVKWSGPIPKIPRLPITKDPKVCDPDGEKTRDLQRLVIGAEGGVANTVVYLKSVARGKAWDLPASEQTLDQKSCAYHPHILLVPVGGAMQIKSSDPVLHTVHMMGAATYNLPFPFQDQFITRTMHIAGRVEMKCNAGHVWMNAEALVVAHPYYAITDAHGNFTLTNVPPGNYEVEAWHEGWKIVADETVLDVGAQVTVKRPIYSQPRTWQRQVTVHPAHNTTVDFQLSEE
ncbi:MAG: carboxypeptidase-like regulatory domain-containing protein [Candidatus Acidiferrales bacterium]